MGRRFLQIHSLVCYAGVNLNQDDSGLSKKLKFGGHLRTVVSSQSKKYHWRHDDGAYALDNLAKDAASYSTRCPISHRVMPDFLKKDRRKFPEDIKARVQRSLEILVHGNTKSGKHSLIMLGEQELRYLIKIASQIADAYLPFSYEDLSLEESEIKRRKKALVEAEKEVIAKYEKNFSAFREAVQLPAGINGAMFGRMVTSDREASISSAISVSPLISVHAQEIENNYMTALDDLAPREAAHIQNTEIHSAIFYGFTVIDTNQLVENVGGDEKLARDMIYNTMHLIAENKEGANKSRTAPFTRAQTMFASMTDQMPFSLAEGYRDPVQPQLRDAMDRMDAHLGQLDNNYGVHDDRAFMSLDERSFRNLGTRMRFQELSEWARGAVG